MMSRLAHRAARTTLGRYQLLWYVASSGIAGALIWIGGTYALAGTGATYNTAPFRCILDLVRNLHTHGLILLVLGLCQMLGLITYWRLRDRTAWVIIRWSMIGILFYSCLCALGFAGAWILNDHLEPGIAWYLFVAVLAGALVALPPPFVGFRGRTDRG